ncbi:unnamed protein product [Polarella glacialis]|uniref:Uncharacterized protein n=1 Tax=Polarella glacialis TaxID=89957 RepID=A0A813HJL0_POLGL|nr:unnamed protein product [Polarella glacialis]
MEPVARALVRSFDGSGEFSISLPHSGPIAQELKRMFLQFSSDTGSRGHHFNRALLTECQNNYESLLEVVDSPTSCKAEAAQAWQRLAMIVTLIGHLYLVKLAPRSAIRMILTDLIPSGDSQPAEIRVVCSHTLLRVVGHALADTDAIYLVAFMGQLVELTAKSSFGAHTRRLVEELQEISTSSWQLKRVLTVRAEMVASHVEVSCANMGGEQVCSFNMMASARLPDLVAEVKSQILNPLDVLTLILPTGALLPYDDETPISDLLRDL